MEKDLPNDSPASSSIPAASPEAEDDAPGHAAPEPRPRRRRLLWLGLLLVLGPYVFYLLGIHFLIYSGLGEKLLTRKPERVQFIWKSGFSWIPGQLHFRDLVIRGRGRKGLWSIEAGGARLNFAPRTLFDRHVLVTSSKVWDARVAWHSNEVEAPADQVPQIDGFSGPYVPPKPKPEKKERWRLEFDDIQFELVELWLDRHRVVAGPKPGQGKLDLQIEIRGDVEMPTVALHMEDAVLHAGTQDRGRVHLLEAKGRIDPFRPRDRVPLAWVRQSHGRVRIEAEGWGVAAASYYFRNAPVKLEGFGEASGDLFLRAGHLQEQSRFSVKGRGLGFEYLGYRGLGDGHLEVRVEGDGAVPPAASGVRFDLELETFTIVNEEQTLLLGEGLVLEASSPTTSLVEAAPMIQAELRLPPSDLPDFAVYDELIPRGAPFSILGGRGKLRGTLAFDTSTGKVDGEVYLSGKGVEAKFQDVPISTDVDLHARLVDGGIETKTFQLEDVSISLENARSGKVQGWWARMEAAGGEICFDEENRHLETQISATLSDPSPFLALLEESRPRAAKWLEALVGEGTVRASGHVLAGSEDLRLGDISLQVGRRWSGRGQLQFADSGYGGLTLLSYGALDVATEFPFAGEREWKLLGAESFYAKKEPAWRRRFGLDKEP